MKTLKEMSNSDLVQIAFDVLTELQRRFLSSPFNVIFRQSPDVLVVKENGVPADRGSWLYLPFLEQVSRFFQPEEDGHGKIYRQFVPKGSRLKLLSRAEKKNIGDVVVKDKKIEINTTT